MGAGYTGVGGGTPVSGGGLPEGVGKPGQNAPSPGAAPSPGFGGAATAAQDQTGAGVGPGAVSTGGTASGYPSLPNANPSQLASSGLQQSTNGTPSVQLGANQSGMGPSAAQANAILPNSIAAPYTAGLQNAAQTSNYDSQSLPAAGQFQQSLYNGSLDPTAQSYLGASNQAAAGYLGASNAAAQNSLQSAAQLSGNQLAQTDAQLGGMYQNGMGSGLAPAEFQAANTASAQLQGLAGQLGTNQANTLAQIGEQQASTLGSMGQQQQSLAAQTLPFTFQEPNTAAAAGQSSAAGLVSQAQNAQYGGINPMESIASGLPVASPTVLAQPQKKAL